ncbi:hypothetical protein EBZ38_11440 [bacterium]|nr:hypothetical protein [bacterium]NDC95095.1 hypothetical protein [bacterium]NDD84865.1 hypothetical protein [bacterium]
MSIKKIKDLPDGSGQLSNDDIFLFMDSPNNGGATKKISLNELKTFLGNNNNSNLNTGDIVFDGSTISTANNDQDLIITTNNNGNILIGADRNMIFDMNAFSGKGILIQDSQEDGYDDTQTPSTLKVGSIYHDTGRMVISSDGTIVDESGEQTGPIYGGIWVTNGEDTGLSIPGQTNSTYSGEVEIKNNNQNWAFGSNGSITLPNGNLIASQADQGETNIQIVDQTSSFKIYTHASSNARGWVYDSEGNLTLPEGSILSETNNTVSIMPPTAASGQSLVIRPTQAIWGMSTSNYIEYGNPITISVSLQSWSYFGTVNYTITGTGVTPQSLGRALTGKLTFSTVSAPETQNITWTIPADSNIAEFTLTLTSVDGIRSTNTETENDPALYYNFEESNGMPIGQYITVTNNGMSNSEHSHVHLLSGDPTTVDLYLGDDDQYIKIEKNGGDVIIGTDSNNNHWTFSTDGKLRLPIDGDILDSNGTSVLGGGSTTVVNLTFSSTINTDASSGDIFDITLTGNTTLANPTNPVNGKTLRWRITQDSTGNRTVTLGNKFNIPSSATSPLPWSAAVNKMDILAATYHQGRDKWDIVAFVPGY